MRRGIIIFISLIAIALNSCTMKAQTDNERIVEITTDYGNIKLKLYNETPQHRDNFIKLVEEGWYEGSPFHRVIEEFMIQGGMNADGRQDPGYTVPAEFVDKYIHKKGVLAAARKGDQVNPQKASSGSQFYIVQGRVFSMEELKAFEGRMAKPFSQEQIDTYTTVGGTPHLDGSYTVYGEVIEGLEVVDKIAAVKTGYGNRPVEEVKMSIKVVK